MARPGVIWMTVRNSIYQFGEAAMKGSVEDCF